MYIVLGNVSGWSSHTQELKYAVFGLSDVEKIEFFPLELPMVRHIRYTEPRNVFGGTVQSSYTQKIFHEEYGKEDKLGLSPEINWTVDFPWMRRSCDTWYGPGT